MMGTHHHQESMNPSSNNIAMKSMRTHQRGGTSESSTTSDNTTDFIDIVKKHDVVYNTHHPDYKNVEVKLKVWTQIAKEIGLSVGMYCMYVWTIIHHTSPYMYVGT